jgi:tetratricopeptide (TPR) repeat protein
MTSAVILALLALGTTPAQSPENTSRFRAVFLEGEALYQQGAYEKSVEMFLAADTLRPTPEAAYNLARAFEKLNDDGKALYYDRLYLRRAPTASDRASIERLISHKLAKAARQQKGYLEVEAFGARWVTVSGTEYRQLPLALLLPRGDHALEVVFPVDRQKAMVQVVEGQETSQTFFASPEALSEGRPWLSVEKNNSQKAPALRQASYWVLGTAAVALLGGAVFGNMSESDASLLNQRQDFTVRQAETLADSANRNGRTANALFLTSGALTAASAGLFVFTLPEPGSKQKEASP